MKNQALVSAIFLVLLPRIVADDEDICGKVECGKGTCKSPAANMAGFVCDCDRGWSQLHFGNHFRFLPCNIPDLKRLLCAESGHRITARSYDCEQQKRSYCSPPCFIIPNNKIKPFSEDFTRDYSLSCKNVSFENSMPPFPNSSTTGNIFDPCFWSYCGDGDCERIAPFAHKCVCKEGFSNLLNISSFPCIKECLLVADCDNLGISLTNTTSSSPKVAANHAEGSVSARNLLWLLLVLVTVLTASQS